MEKTKDEIKAEEWASKLYDKNNQSEISYMECTVWDNRRHNFLTGYYEGKKSKIDEIERLKFDVLKLAKLLSKPQIKFLLSSHEINEIKDLLTTLSK